MMLEIGPCDVKPGMVHLLIITIQSLTTVLVAWLTVRARRKDKEEVRRNGHSSNGH